VRRLYSFCIYLLAPLAFAAVLWRGIRNRGYWQGLGERFGFGPPGGPAPCIWLHAVSLGEVSAAASLVRALRARHPDIPVILTTATPTGRARARALFGESADVRFLPYDTPGSVRRFLLRIRPRLAIIMETELWPNLYLQCERMGVPLVLANARLSAKSVSRYRRFGSLFRGVFSATKLIAAQTAEDAMRFSAIGAKPGLTHVIGNVKFDQDVGPATLDEGRALRSRYWGGRPTWIAGSTHAGEEEQVLSAHAALRSHLPQALLLLVPRHPDRFDSVAELLQGREFAFERRSLAKPVPMETPVVLVDTVGELAALYAAADVAFVGGSLVPVGGHNLLEPAALGLPVLTGPFNSNGQEIVRLLVEQGAAVQVADAQELAAWLARLLEDADQRRGAGEAGRRAVEANRGSVARLLELIEPLVAEAEARP
jgi:3-deoxy-D-manno-octulosonic-acid transferase